MTEAVLAAESDLITHARLPNRLLKKPMSWLQSSPKMMP